MAKLESKFQKELMDEIRERYPGCMITKNDSSYIQGIPDWTIFYRNKYAILEAKREEKANYYVEQFDKMSFSRFVYPENKDEVLRDLDIHFRR